MLDLATRADRVAETGEQLQQHRDLFRSNAALQAVMRNRGITAEAKMKILTAVFERTQPEPLLRNFLLLLVRNDRLHQFELICDHYERMANERLGRITAEVTTAIALNEDQYQAVAQKVTTATQKEVTLERRVDPSILGGLIVRINHTILDGSLRGQLSRLRQELIGG
jgi:F-type H+-transporting ATPase subunit delta